ncbi:MAG: hypothetical protein ACK5LX_05165 [Oscillospiraceae bacterium]
MKRVITLSYILLLLLLCACSISETTEVVVPDSWKGTSPPTIGSDEWYRANRSLKNTSLKIDNGTLAFDEDSISYKYETRLDAENGYLIGTDGGEWGGEVSYV